MAAYFPGEDKSTVDLFIPKAELADLMWSVPPPTIEEAAATHDVTTVQHPSSFLSNFEALVKALPDALVHTLPKDVPQFPQLPEQYLQPILKAQKGSDIAITDMYLLTALQRTRLIKDKDEINLIKHANKISSRAHEVVMRVLGKAVKGKIERAPDAGVSRPLLPGEWLIEKEAEAEALFVASCRREG